MWIDHAGSPASSVRHSSCHVDEQHNPGNSKFRKKRSHVHNCVTCGDIFGGFVLWENRWFENWMKIGE